MTQTLSQLYQRFNQLRGRRIFIVPTRFGFVYAGFLLLILLSAINYSNSIGHVLSFLLASLALVAMLHTYRNLAKIELDQAHAEAVFCGQTIHFILAFDNQANHDSVQIEVASKQPEPRSWNPYRAFMGFQHYVVIPHLAKQQTTQIRLSLISQKRGKQPLGRIRISSQFPLGLYNTWSYFNPDLNVLVYPRSEGNLPLPEAIDQGQQVSYRQTKGMDDFSGFNHYRRGDPVHAIAWKAVARDDVMRTKQFTSSQGGHLMLCWQDVAQLSDLEARLSQLCRWILQAEAAGISYGLNLPNTTIDYGAGNTHYHRCLTALALYP